MTLRELSQLYYIKKEIQMDRRRLDELRLTAGGIASPLADGMPHVRSGESKVAQNTEKILELERIIKDKMQRCVDERIKLERYIASVDDTFIRQILTLRFVDGLSWRAVAFKLGGGNTSNTVRVACYRWIKKGN